MTIAKWKYLSDLDNKVWCVFLKMDLFRENVNNERLWFGPQTFLHRLKKNIITYWLYWCNFDVVASLSGFWDIQINLPHPKYGHQLCDVTYLL